MSHSTGSQGSKAVKMRKNKYLNMIRFIFPEKLPDLEDTSKDQTWSSKDQINDPKEKVQGEEVKVKE